MKKIFLIIILSSATLLAQSAGKSGASFLKNGFGARNIAMGDLGVVGVNDLTALNYNPALLSEYQAPQVMLTHNQSIQDLSTQLVGASFSLWGIPLAVGINNTSINDLEIRTVASDEPQSYFNAHYMFGSLSTGFQIYENLSFGVTTKYVYENLFSDEAAGWAFDFGLSYFDIIDGLDIGASYRNIGSLDKLRNEATKLPADLRLGLAYGLDINSINSELNLIGGVQKYVETDDTHIHAGGEVFYDNIIALRLGYMTGYESKGLTAGLGLYWEGLNFDYAFTPYSFGLGSAHTISLMYSF